MADKNDLTRKLAAAQDKRRSLYKNIAEVSKKASDEKRSFTPEEDTKYNQMNDDIDVIDSEIRAHEDALRSIDAQAADDQRTAEEIRSGEATVTNPFESDQYRSAFESFIRTGSANDLRDLKRSLSGSTTNAGEEFVPTDFFSQVESRIAEETSLTGLIDIQTIGSRHAKFAIHTGLSVAVPRDEGEAYGVKDPSTGQKTVQAYNFGHITKVSEELLADGFTDVAAFIAADQGQAYGNAIEAYGLLGSAAESLFSLTGTTGKVPGGLLNDAGITEVETAASGTITMDDIIDLIEDLPSSVSSRASILTHKSVTKALRKMKDGNGQYLWQPNTQAGRPSLFSGVEVHRSDYMPTSAAGATPLLIGDFSRVTMFLRQQMTIMRLNERFRDSGEIGFRGSLRMDILAKQPAALRKLKVKA